jgi:hypothetical protein
MAKRRRVLNPVIQVPPYFFHHTTYVLYLKIPDGLQMSVAFSKLDPRFAWPSLPIVLTQKDIPKALNTT